MVEDQVRYTPALRFERLTGLYDTVMSLFMRETTFKKALILQGGVEKDHQVLDLGCGTATLTLLLKRLNPDARVTGLDGDPKALGIARAKISKSGLQIILDKGLSYEMPYPDCSFDRVFSSLLFHHLTRQSKERTSREIRRVLRLGGELHVADWGKPINKAMRLAFYMVQILDGFETTSDNVNGRLPDFFSEAGLEDIRETRCFATIFGSVSFYKARKTH